jgi:MYXO-CTERM domain-containing protein
MTAKHHLARRAWRGPSAILAGLGFACVLLASGPALAGEVKFGTAPLAVDDSGNLTAEGKKAAVAEVPSVPGDEEWVVHLWAKLDKGAPGPLYVEFYDKTPDGQTYLAYRHEHGDYDGEKYVSMELELEGGKGFNKNHTYRVELTQADTKGKDIKLASGSLKLGWTPAPKQPEEGKGDKEGKAPEESKDSAEQDALDTLVGGEEGGPAPTDPKGGKKNKKGCTVDGAAYGVPGVLVLFALGFAGRRRPR